METQDLDISPEKDLERHVLKILDYVRYEIGKEVGAQIANELAGLKKPRKLNEFTPEMKKYWDNRLLGPRFKE